MGHPAGEENVDDRLGHGFVEIVVLLRSPGLLSEKGGWGEA